MRAGLLAVLWTSLLLSQGQQQDPFDVVIQAFWSARGSGHFAEAVKKRDEARRIVAAMPVEAQQFSQRLQSVAQFYDTDGLAAEGRGLLEQSLARMGQRPSADRVTLLFALANSWEQDRNLLKAVTLLEQAIAELEKLPPAEPGERSNFVMITGRLSYTSAPPQAGGMQDYLHLANLYRQLGRREALTRLTETIAKRASSNDALAMLYEQDGQPDQAAAIYKRQAEQASGDPQQASAALQSLARIHQNQQEYAESASAFRQAASVLEASDRPEIRSQAMWVRQNLAMVLVQAGQVEEADKLFKQLLADTPAGQDGARNQLLLSYANHLLSTKRGPQAEALLNDQLANQPNLQPWEESNILFTLASAARTSGDETRAQSYQRTAEEKQQAMQASGQPEQVLIGADLQRAQTSANTGNVEEAVQLTMRAIQASPQAVDRDQVAWMVPNIAYTIGLKDRAAGEGLYSRLFELLESWSAETVQPLFGAYQSRARYLMQQQRWRELPEVIDRYRTALIAARSEGTGWLEDVLRLRIEAARAQNAPETNIADATELLKLEEGLNGTTSEAYLRAVETLAETLEANGDNGRSLPLRRQAIGIVDLVSPASDARRVYTRMNAAFALVRAQQFDEAEQIAVEAVKIAGLTRPPQTSMCETQLNQIREMKSAARRQTNAEAQPYYQRSTVGTGSRWFDSNTFAPAPAQPQK